MLELKGMINPFIWRSPTRTINWQVHRSDHTGVDLIGAQQTYRITPTWSNATRVCIDNCHAFYSWFQVKYLTSRIILFTTKSCLIYLRMTDVWDLAANRSCSSSKPVAEVQYSILNQPCMKRTIPRLLITGQNLCCLHQQLFDIYVDLRISVLRTATKIGEVDAIQVDSRYAVTSRHAHFVISWATVEGTCGYNWKLQKTMLCSLIYSFGHAASSDSVRYMCRSKGTMLQGIMYCLSVI